MLGEKIDYILRGLETDISEIAKYAGATRSAFSHLRGGSRNYDRSSRTVRRFADGLCTYAEMKEKTDTLCRMISSDGLSGNELRSAAVEWLFSGEPPSHKQERPDPVLFGKKLSALMELAGVSGSKLSRELNIDASYISRMRSGERMPNKKDQLISRMCSCLAMRIRDSRRLKELGEVIGVPEEYISADSAAGNIFEWLCGQEDSEDVSTVKALIRTIESLPDSFPDASADIAPELVSPMIVTAGEYSGDEGLRSAVIRFLAEASEQRASELLLYSDRDMDWIDGDFRKIWSALMLRCVRSGVMIKIIHNVERSAAEMIKAITNWLPIYMTGMVTSWYNTVPKGGRFSNTFFLMPGKSCIEGNCICGMEEMSEYRYITDAEKLRIRGLYFDKLMEDSRPLIRFSTGPGAAVGNYSVYNIGHIQICIGKREVIVNKLTGHLMNFRITHPILCRAFRSFAESIV